MTILLDTSVAIPLRDGDPDVRARANGLALATRNPEDFKDIPGLVIEAW